MKATIEPNIDLFTWCIITLIVVSLSSCRESSSHTSNVASVPATVHSADEGVSAITATSIVALQTIEAALANQPTTADMTARPTPAATIIGGGATMQAAINATLTALAPTSTLPPTPTSTPTPHLGATQTAQSHWLATAVAATLTAQAQMGATQTAQSPTPFTAKSPEEPIIPSTLERIRFPRGSTGYTFSPQLVSGIVQGYVLEIAAGQQMFVVAANVTHFFVLDPDNNELQPLITSSGQRMFTIAKTGDYTLNLSGDGKATIAIDIPPLPTRIQFSPGSTAQTFITHLTTNALQAYTLWVSGGQQIFIEVNQLVEILALDPTGSELPPDAQSAYSWQFTTTQSGDHTIILHGAGELVVTIMIPPL